jgi:hypothetical protein
MSAPLKLNFTRIYFLKAISALQLPSLTKQQDTVFICKNTLQIVNVRFSSFF